MLTTIDLFCGAGGITEGFRQAGYSCLYGNDFNEWAIRSFGRNHEEAWADDRKVEEIDPRLVRKKLGIKKGELDVLCGGPPCQGFSINAPERFLDDPRNILFKHSIRFLDEFRPKTFLLENVPGMLSLADGKIYSLVLKELTKLGYQVAVKILFAGHYGVPQERWRLIILGSMKNILLKHPEPTHFAQARANFRGGSTMTFRLLPLDQVRLQPAVTVKDAIGDLPKLKMGEGGEVMEYKASPQNDYAEAMREGSDKVYNHYAAKLSSVNIERLKHIKPGGSWPDIPFRLLPPGMQKARRSDHTRRYGRLKHDGLSGTIMTKCDPHWGAVFLPSQDRSLT